MVMAMASTYLLLLARTMLMMFRTSLLMKLHKMMILKKYPVFFSDEQHKTLLALYDRLEQGSNDAALLKQFHEASLALFTTAAENHKHHRLHNPIEAFIVTFNLRWMDPSDGPEESRQIWGAIFSFVQQYICKTGKSVSSAVGCGVHISF